LRSVTRLDRAMSPTGAAAHRGATLLTQLFGTCRAAARAATSGLTVDVQPGSVAMVVSSAMVNGGTARLGALPFSVGAFHSWIETSMVSGRRTSTDHLVAFGVCPLGYSGPWMTRSWVPSGNVVHGNPRGGSAGAFDAGAG